MDFKFLFSPLGIHFLLGQPFLSLFQGDFLADTLGDTGKQAFVLLQQEQSSAQPLALLVHLTELLFQGFIALLFQVDLVLVPRIAFVNSWLTWIPEAPGLGSPHYLGALQLPSGFYPSG